MFNGNYSVNNYKSFINSSFESSGADIIILSNITNEENKYICTLGGVEILIEKFYIFRRQGFLTTIVVQLAEDIWDFVKNKAGEELIINWQSESFNGEMANSLVQDVSYRQDSARRIIKLHAFRSKKEVATHKFILDEIEIKQIESGVLQSVTCNPQPSISPEDTVTIAGVDYIVNSVKITADKFRTRMVVNFG